MNTDTATAKPPMKRLQVRKAAAIRLTAMCACPYHIVYV